MEKDFEIQINRILSKAKKLDIKLGEVISLETVRKVEKEKKINLPESYIIFLTRIENGGIGPYHGIYSLEESINQSELTEANLKTENPYIQDYDIEDSEKEKLSDEDFQNIIGETISIFFEGSIDVCEYGCGDFFRLILAGESKGTVWSYSYDDTALYNLNVDILTFFENWLDRKLDEQLNPNKKYLAEFSCLEFGENTHYKSIID